MRRAKVEGGNVFDRPETIEGEYWNLHDAFVNVELLRTLMNKAPVEGGPLADPIQFFRSYRGRFERLYIGLLWVVIEAWQRRREVREFCSGRVSTEELVAALRQAEPAGGLKSMKDVRDYTFHRDKREYWDPGRVGAVGYMHIHEGLYQALARMFLAVSKSLSVQKLEREAAQ